MIGGELHILDIVKTILLNLSYDSGGFRLTCGLAKRAEEVLIKTRYVILQLIPL